MERWQVVILEWVNCLKIADPIVGILSLPKSHFFKGILQKLCKNDSIQELDQSMVQNRLYRFIRDSYPDYELAYDGDVTTDIKELIYICSLLMYYCAIHSEDPSLKDPPCNLLSGPSQKLYMMFLKSILDSNATAITRELVSIAIKDACDEVSKSQSPKRPKSTESLRTPLKQNKSSPNILCFTDYIQSPEAKKQKHLEYITREMRNLKAELATERDEKLDLQEDIRRQNEQIHKLNKDLERKQLQISQLDNKILEIQQEKEQTPPKPETTPLFIKLRANLREAEKRIVDLQSELNEKDDENKSLTHKLTGIKNELLTYKQACADNDSVIRNLNEVTQKQTLKINELTSEVSELKNIVSEYQTSNSTKVVLNDSFTVYEPENLGVVIELQLKEIQNENDALKQKYEQLQLENINLQQEINTTKSEIVQYREELSQAQIDTSKFKFEIENLNRESKKFEKEIKDLNQDLIIKNSKVDEKEKLNREIIEQIEENKKRFSELNIEKDNLNKEIIQLKENLTIKNKKLQEMEHNFNETKIKLESTQNILQSKLKQIDIIECQLKTLQDNENLSRTKIEELQQIVQDKELSFNETYTKLKLTENQLELNLKQLETMEYKLKILQDDENLSKVKIEELTQTMKEKESGCTELSIKLRTTQNELDLKLKQIQTMDNQIETLLNEANKSENLSKIRIESLEHKIQELEHMLKSTENELVLKHTQIKNMETALKDETTKIEKLSKEKIESLEQTLHIVEHNFKETSVKLAVTQNELKMKCIQVETMENELKKLQNETNKIEMLSKHKTEILEQKNQELEHDINELNSKLRSTESELKLKCAQIETMVIEVKILQNDKSSSRLKIEELQRSIQEYERNCNEINTKLKSTQKELELKSNQIEIMDKKLIEEQSLSKIKIEELERNIDESKQKFNEMSSKLNATENELNLKLSQIETMANELKTLQNERIEEKENLERKSAHNLASLESELRAQIEMIENELKTKINEFKDTIQEKDQFYSNLERKNMNNLALIEVLNKQVMKLQPLVDEKDGEIVSLTRQLEDIKKQLKQDKLLLREHEKKLNEYNSICDSKSAFINKLESQLSHLGKNFKESESRLSEKNKTINNLEIIIANYDTEITDLKRQLDDNDHHIMNLNVHEEELIREYEKEIDKCNSTISTLKSSIVELETLVKQSQSEKDHFTQSNQTMIANFEQLENEKVTLNDELRVQKKNLENLQDKFDLLCLDCNSIKDSNEKLLKENQNLRTQINEFEMKNNELNKELSTLKNENVECINEKVTLIAQLEEMKKNISQQLDVNKQLDYEKQIKIIELSDSKKLYHDLLTDKEKLTQNYSEKLENFEFEKKNLNMKLNDLELNFQQLVTENINLTEKLTNMQNEMDVFQIEKENYLKTTSQLENSNLEIKSKIFDISKELELQRDSNKILLAEKQNLSKTIIELESKISVEFKATNESKVKELLLTQQQLTGEHKKTSNELLMSLEKITSLEDDYKKIFAENEIYRKDLNEIQTQMKIILEEKSRLTKEHQLLEQTLDELKIKRAHYTDLARENGELKEQISRLRDENSILTRKCDSLQCEYEESQILTKKIIAENDILIEKKSEFENKNMDLNAELLQMKKELLIVNETNCDLENRYKLFMNENGLKIQHLEEQVQINKFKSVEFTKQYEQSQKDLEMLKESANTEKEYYERLINQKDQSIKELSDVLRRYKDQIDQIGMEKLKNQDKNMEIEKKYTEMLMNQDKMNEKLQRFEMEKIENEKIINKKDRFISDLEMITTNLKDEVTKLAEKNVMLIKEIDILNSTLTTIQNENKTLSENIENSQQKTRKVLSEKEKELEDAQKEYKILEKKLFEIENEKMKINTEKQRLQDELQTVKTSRDQLLTNHTEMSNKVDDYIHKNFELRKQIERLEKQLVYEKDSRSEIQQMLRKQTDISEKSQEYVKLNVELQKKIENLEKMLRIESENATKNEKAIKDQIKSAASDQRELQSQIEQLNHENALLKTEKENLKIDYLSPRPELIKLREAYEQVVSENSQLQYELNTLRKSITEKELQLNEYEKLKEGYEKLFKECDNLKTELDTMKEKRLRDKEEYKIRLEQSTKLNEEKMRELRIDYDVKLEKMKNRMKQLYAEEVAKSEKKKEAEHEQLCKSYQEKMQNYEEYIKDLQSQMWTVGDKFLGEQQSKERMHKQLNDVMKRASQMPSSRHEDILSYNPSHESLQNVGRESMIFREKTTTPLDALFATRSRDSLSTKPEKRDSYLSIGGNEKSKKPVSFMVVPTKNGREKKSNRVGPIQQEFKEPNTDQPMRNKRLPRSSVPATLGGQGLHMEDEEVEMFHTNYLSDLQSGRCVPASTRLSSPTNGGASDKSRLTELQVRNSLCPPHLKSSYPAETQFHSPSKFKEDDLKTGNVHLDDSLNTCLLPDEKPRRKESTFYKKPGPSTPSKRSSFQGNEARDILREQNKTSDTVNNSNTLNNRKTSTPNRLIKALFSNRSQSLRAADTENQPVTPRNRRYNIFRKQR